MASYLSFNSLKERVISLKSLQMTDNKWRAPSDAKIPHCLWQSEPKRLL